MPAISLERVPLPSLQTYTSISVLLLACCLLYAHQTVTSKDAILGVLVPVSKTQNSVVTMDTGDPEQMVINRKDGSNTSYTATSEELRTSSTSEDQTKDNIPDESLTLTDYPDDNLNITLPYEDYMWNMIFILTTEVWCVWTLVNTAYCCLILIAKAIQKVVFGELRVSEQQHLKDKFWNFVFYKFIFVFGVMNVQTMEEVVLWVAWFSSLGFFHLITQLCKDRFEYLSFSPTTPQSSHIKLLVLLSVVLVSCIGLMSVCLYTGLYAGITIFSFMAAECILLSIRTLYVLVRYFIHLYDMNMESVWENRSSYVYFTELIFELAALSIDFSHHLHMLLWGNIFLSMASLVICMQLRYLFYEFQRRIKRHKNYLRVVRNMDAKFPMATVEELEKNADNCAICWEKMDAARKLPCGHLFHNACLRSSLEQDTACPTCRMSLGDDQPTEREGGAIPLQPPNAANDNQATNQAANQALVNHFFHFDGSRYVSWLPSFSVEVTHTSLMPGQQQPRIQTSQLDNMARQVQNVFPSMPLPTIMDDLRVTRSVDLTIDNILEGRLVAPPTTTLRTESNEGGAQAIDSIPVVSETTTSNMLSAPSPNPPPSEEFLNFLRFGTDTGDADDEDSNDDDNDNEVDDDDHLFPSFSPITTDNLSLIEDSSSLHVSGGRFSKSSSERMEMLTKRKSHMMDQARRRFLLKATPDSVSTNTSDLELASTENLLIQSDLASTETLPLQRNRILQATERRLNTHDSTS